MPEGAAAPAVPPAKADDRKNMAPTYPPNPNPTVKASPQAAGEADRPTGGHNQRGRRPR